MEKNGENEQKITSVRKRSYSDHSMMKLAYRLNKKKLDQLIEKEDNEIKLSKENISEMTNELLNLSAKYFNIEIKLSRMSKEQEQIEKELYNLKIDLSYKDIISFSAIISNINQIKKIISYIISNVNLDKLYHPKIRQIYKSSYDEKQGKAFIEQLIGNSFIIILVKISQETIFGGFFYKNITTNSNIYDENAFLFSLNHDEYYKINKGKRPYWINKKFEIDNTKVENVISINIIIENKKKDENDINDINKEKNNEKMTQFQKIQKNQ